MKTKLTFLILMFCVVCFSCGRRAQESVSAVPELAVIANNETITEEQFLDYDEQDYVEKVPVATATPRSQAGTPGINEVANDFEVQMINGETIRLSDLRGNVVLLNFWATWCGPCIRKFQALPSTIIEPFRNSAFVLLPISTGETMETVVSRMAIFREERGIHYFNVGVDPDRSIFSLFPTGFIPRSFLIDKNGVIRHISAGFRGEECLENIASVIRELLGGA